MKLFYCLFEQNKFKIYLFVFLFCFAFWLYLNYYFVLFVHANLFANPSFYFSFYKLWLHRAISLKIMYLFSDARVNTTFKLNSYLVIYLLVFKFNEILTLWNQEKRNLNAVRLISLFLHKNMLLLKKYCWWFWLLVWLEILFVLLFSFHLRNK